MPSSRLGGEIQGKGTRRLRRSSQRAALALVFSSVYSLCASPSCVIHEGPPRVSPPPAVLKCLRVCVTLSSPFMQWPFFSINPLSQRQNKNNKPAPCLCPSTPLCPSLSRSHGPRLRPTARLLDMWPSGRVSGACHVTRQPHEGLYRYLGCDEAYRLKV